jgi:hypothetical protein
MLGNETFRGEWVGDCKKPALYKCRCTAAQNKKGGRKRDKKKRIASKRDLRAM